MNNLAVPEAASLPLNHAVPEGFGRLPRGSHAPHAGTSAAWHDCMEDTECVQCVFKAPADPVECGLSPSLLRTPRHRAGLQPAGEARS